MRLSWHSLRKRSTRSSICDLYAGAMCQGSVTTLAPDSRSTNWVSLLNSRSRSRGSRMWKTITSCFRCLKCFRPERRVCGSSIRSDSTTISPRLTMRSARSWNVLARSVSSPFGSVFSSVFKRVWIKLFDHFFYFFPLELKQKCKKKTKT